MKSKHLISYAQNREDVIIDGFFTGREEGFYVDVGSGSPFQDTVTKLFYDKGWKGINIDPIDRLYKAIKKDRPRDINLNVGVSNKPGSLKFREYEGDGFSTFSPTMKSQNSSTGDIHTKNYRDYEVPVTTLAAIFKENNVNSIQFLKVDVEGYEYEVLESNDWEKYRPELLCVEANHVNQDWRPLIKKHGYELAFFDGLNEYFASTESGLKDKFSYVDSIIYREPIVNYRLLEDFKKYEDKIKELKDKVNLQEKHIEYVEFEMKAAQKESKRLNSLIQEITPLNKHIKRQVGARVKKLSPKKTDRKG